MQQLQFVELDEGGRLVVAGEDGTRYAVTVDDRLRAALRPRPVATHPDRGGAPAVSPRDVQALIRAGQTAEDVAALTGWELDRVRRFEGPVLAEREHLVGLAQRAHVRAAGRTDGSHTLDRRVRERLSSRGVELAEVTWDAARHEAHGPWTVLVVFAAGGRERRAAWHYDVRSRSIEALDDEARWLSEDEQSLPGGLGGHPLLGAGHGEDEVAADLMATMRERRQRRGRRQRKDATHDPAHVPGGHDAPDEVLPLEDLHYDPDTMGEPHAAHPRGSAPESAVPVGPDEFDLDDEPEGTSPAGDAGAGAADARISEPGRGSTEETADETGGEATETTEEPSGEATKEPAGHGRRRGAPRKPPARKERRRLRMPKLPVPVDGPVEEDHEPSPEHSFARRRDPDEVSFEEFFGTDEEEVLEHHLYDEEPAQEQVEEVHDAPDADLGEVQDADPGDAGGTDPSDAQDESDGHGQDRPRTDELDLGLDDEPGRTTRLRAVPDAPADDQGDDPAAGEPDVDEPDVEGPADAMVDEEQPDATASAGTKNAAEGADTSGTTAPEGSGPPAGEQAEGAGDAETPEEQVSPPKPSPPKPRAPKPSPPGRKGRTSVPSWDDIMFGSRDQG